jgi:hypothetical protein
MLGLVRRRAAACLVGLVGLRSLALTATTYSTPSGRVDRPSDIVATSGHKGSNHFGGVGGWIRQLVADTADQDVPLFPADHISLERIRRRPQ